MNINELDLFRKNKISLEIFYFVHTGANLSTEYVNSLRMVEWIPGGA